MVFFAPVVGVVDDHKFGILCYGVAFLNPLVCVFAVDDIFTGFGRHHILRDFEGCMGLAFPACHDELLSVYKVYVGVFPTEFRLRGKIIQHPHFCQIGITWVEEQP